MHDFGYVALNFKYTYPEDSGTYTCRAVNELGEAVTSSTLFVECKYFISNNINRLFKTPLKGQGISILKIKYV